MYLQQRAEESNIILRRVASNTPLVISFGIRRETENIVYGDIVELRQANQYLCRNISLPQFIVAVDPLGAVENVGNFSLLQIYGAI